MKTEITISGTNEFGWFTTTKTIKTDLDPEQTFINMWKKLPRHMDKTWGTMEFEQDGISFCICRNTLKETGMDFWKSNINNN